MRTGKEENDIGNWALKENGRNLPIMALIIYSL